MKSNPLRRRPLAREHALQFAAREILIDETFQLKSLPMNSSREHLERFANCRFAVHHFASGVGYFYWLCMGVC